MCSMHVRVTPSFHGQAEHWEREVVILDIGSFPFLMAGNINLLFPTLVPKSKLGTAVTQKKMFANCPSNVFCPRRR